MLIDGALRVIILEIGIIVSFSLIVFIIFKNFKSYEYEKKFQDFSLLSNKDTDISFFERLTYYFWELVHSFSNVLSYSKIIEKHSKKFENDMVFEKKNIQKPIDYISIKVLCSCIFIVIFCITTILQYETLDVMQLLIITLVGYFFPNIIIVYKRKIRKDKIEEDLLKAIIIMNNSFKSGRNIMQAIETVKNELDGPIADEFKKISLDISYGLSLDTVFNRFYNRVQTEDAKYIASSLTLLNKTGGNIVKVFSMIEQSFFDRKKLKNELESLTASSVFVFRLLTFMPVIFVLLINFLNKDYFKPLISSPLGIVLLIIILALYVFYIVIIRKVLKVDM